MNLNLSNSGGGSGNYIRFSPQANAWSNTDGEFQLKKCVFDIDALQTGWMLIAIGQYEFIADEVFGKKGAQPSPEHRRGFKAHFYNKEMGVVEWSANGVGHNMGLQELHDKCSTDRGANPSKLPVIEYTGSRAEKVGKGTTRVPQFTVTGWVARPAGLDADPHEGDFIKSVAQTPAPAPAPAAKAAPAKPAVNLDDDEMFA